MRLLVVASQNHGKLAELRTLLEGLRVSVRSAAEVLGHPVEVVEDGDTFEANALKKAHAIAALTSELTLADDSGLCVDALGGAPGVRSARFAGEQATDAENNAALVGALRAVPSAGGLYSARFRCVLAVVDPTRGLQEPMRGVPPRPPLGDLVVEGVCEGAVIASPRGARGFGYDPHFLVEATGHAKTMAELSHDEKNRVSHRARAFQALRPALEAWLAGAG